MLFRLEQCIDGQWVVLSEGLSATLAAFGAVLAELKKPGAPWRAIREDGEIFYP